MRNCGEYDYSFANSPPCGGYGFVIGSDRRLVSISLDCGRWDCPDCRKKLTSKWLNRIDEDLPGSVLYMVSTKLSQKSLSVKIRRNIEQGKYYFCAHLNDGALVFSNAKFKGAKPRNRQRFLKEIRALVERGKVAHFSRRKDKKRRDQAPDRKPWSFATVTEDLKSEFMNCRSDYEIGLLILKHRGTSNVHRLSNLGKELLQKIQRKEINSVTCNLKDLE